MQANGGPEKSVIHAILTSPRVRTLVLTLADQAVNSGANFLTGVLVGRLLSIGEFGEFSLGMTLVIFSLILQDTLLATPYTFHFHGKGKSGHAALRAGALVQSFMLGLVCSLLLLVASGLAGYLANGGTITPILTSLGVSLPFLFFRECLRRQYFTEFQMGRALGLDVVVTILQFALLFGAWKAGILHPATVFAVMALAAALGGGWAWLRTRGEYDFRTMDVAHDTRENVLYGRWLLAGSFCHLGSLYAYPWLVYLLYGKEEAGAFAACYSLINLLNPLILGFNNYFRPRIIKTKMDHGVSAMHGLVRTACLLFLPAAVLVVLFFAAAGDFLVRIVYGSEFSGLGAILAIVGISLIPVTLNAPLQLGVLALNKPHINPAFHAVSLATTMLVGVPLVLMFGKMGAAAGYSLATAAGFMTLLWLYRREIRRQRQ